MTARKKNYSQQMVILQDLIAQRDVQLATLYASTSWRITAPLRWVRRLLQGRAQTIRPTVQTPEMENANTKMSGSYSALALPSGASLRERLAILAKGKVRVAYFAENVNSSTFRYRAANMVAVLNAPNAEKDALNTSAACFFLDDLSLAVDLATIADILVISRTRYDLATAALVQGFKAQGKKVWFDIDDWVFDVQAIDLIIQTSGQCATDEVMNYWHAVVSRMGTTLRLCDGAITTNSYLAQKIAEYVDVPVKVIANFANAQQIEVSQPIYQRKLSQGMPSSQCIKLGYFSGSASHNRDLALLLPALEIVMAADSRVTLVLVGPVELGELSEVSERFEKKYDDRITRHAFTDYVYLQHLIGDVDFNLVPLQVNDFTHCKSELKFVDAAIVGTLTIASPAFAYAEAIRHGENGYLAEDDQWETVLLQAIAVRDADFEKHSRMTAAALQDVQLRFTWQTQRPTIMHALELG
jgi:glycosyltransferase involved in cell wall biosynthesis